MRRRLRYLRLAVRQTLLARLSPRVRRLYRWRKQLAAVLSVRYGLAPGGLALLLEDDERCAHYLQRFLAEHQVPYTLPYYDQQGRYLFASPAKVEVLASALLREDRDFHSLQTLEAAAYQATLANGTPAGRTALIAAARYLAAHCPTSRAELQTFRIAQRLSRGERLFDDEPADGDA